MNAKAAATVVVALAFGTVLLSAGVAFSGAPASSSAALQQALATAQAALKSKDMRALVGALEQALGAARTEAGPHIRAAVVVDHDHTGLGLYTPQPGGLVPGRRLRLYVELEGHKLAPVSDGVWQVSLAVSGRFSYLDQSNPTKPERVDLGERALGSQTFTTRSAQPLTSMGLELSLSEQSPPGRYTVALVVKDNQGGGSASRDVDFVLR